MKVRCKINDKSVLPPEIYEKYSENLDDHSLVLGKEYTVYAFAYFEESVWYSICAENFDLFPIYKHFSFFEISNPQLSRFWIFDLYTENFKELEVYVSFPEWIQEEYFYSNLVDGEKESKKFSIGTKS